MCLSPYVETFNSKVIKRFCTWTKKLLRVFEFRDSYVLCVYVMYICYQHSMSISPILHMAISWICNNIWETSSSRQMKLNRQNKICTSKFEWEIQRYVDSMNDFRSFQYVYCLWHDRRQVSCPVPFPQYR